MSSWENPNLPLWLRVALLTVDRADSAGTLLLGPRELLCLLAPDASTEAKHISRAIHTAKRYGALRAGSTARHLYLAHAWGGPEGLW